MKLKLTQTLLTCSILGLTACGELTPEEAQVIESKDVGQVAQFLRNSNPVRDEFIVVLRDDVQRGGASAVAREMAAARGGEVLATYEHALKGFAVRMPEARVRELLADPRVKYIEENGYVHAIGTQSSATWGIDRTDQRDLPLNSTYNYNVDGTGAHAYIIDTGIRLTHAEFTGRWGANYDAVTDGGNANDCQGHGTHVAGTVAGTTWGIAKKATVHAVRVLNCQGSGTNADVIEGMDWVTANHQKPAVANMSLGGGASQATDDAVQRMFTAGVTVAVAAGNDNANACNYSPARAANAITVGSTTSTDARSSFSNYGTCLDIFAPGSSITSASFSSDTGSTSMSGTSMASPHVAGVAALYLGANPSATPQQVRDALVNNGTAGKVTSAGTGSPNVLLYSMFIGGSTPPPSNVLTNGVATAAYSGAAGSWKCWTLSVPTGRTSVVFNQAGGTGDADLYVKLGSAPTTTSYNCRPYLSGNTETCTISNPAAGTWYACSYGYSSYSSTTMKGTY